ncbi:MAG: endonuclease/exonuclease/phosphatase family protein [Microcoleus sp. PH2017_10_PVI_O_A]|uniref:endonuclease/exonuclease/phosphatase family protein n=1 Tax=unclassified Microcoleus TaxID=2642155 RepID=UPI001D7274D9|nr:MULTISPECIES: endonuclease/exonuclease/phosphatase family protein [unclassified Microcoleus]TAE81538.1 MAG: endonuclease/exonuclease/phosphatase [Oscillatoriales cyanobacterium]MCC3404949.1 endonuclease/exonuclease/phosphatase family protein [Microcoleus sp. PH2017_10_PVI_O_A]MCC3461172.1 endonuclease/exonuclease/phosphatase family protein [Microcoleus sp. PH2017_11_PCY_U_A]MCC3479122.1 endonuclease/exonuclease/phosphatase family protein [Microcoleus sp. PH2017_12_PCY_D_A]MCC3527298.1 endon
MQQKLTDIIKRVFKQSVTIVAYSYSLFIICYFLLQIFSGERISIIALISTFLPLILFPIFLLPIVGFSIIKKRWFSVISAIGCILLISWLHIKYFSPAPITSTDSQPSLKILSHNVGWHKTQSPTLFKLIDQQKPDLIFLQEIVQKHTQRAFTWLKAEYPYQIGTPPVGILSKYPIVSSEILHLAGHPETQQRAIIKFNQQEIVIYNMQATGPWFKRYNILPFLKIPIYKYGKRSPEIQDLVQRVEQETLPVIVAGDFNMTDETKDYYNVQKVLQDSFRKSGFGFGFTWPHGWELKFLVKSSNLRLNYPVCRIDYIWYSKHWGAKSSSVLEATESDHLPVGAELVLLK